MRLTIGYRAVGLATVAAVATLGAGSAFAAANVSAPSILSFTPTKAKVGTKIMISGTNLTGATSVKVDGMKTKFKVVSQKSISLTIPAKAKTGKLTVVTKSGTATSKKILTVA